MDFKLADRELVTLEDARAPMLGLPQIRSYWQNAGELVLHGLVFASIFSSIVDFRRELTRDFH